MFFTKLKRVIKSGFISFWRNGSVSLAAVLVMIVTLSVILSLVLVGILLNSTLTGIKDRVDINVYITKTAEEPQILALKTALEKLPQVLTVSYQSRDEALVEFKARHQNDELILQALDEVSDNPLRASLTIKAVDPSQYETIANFLVSYADQTQDQGKIIDKANYPNNKDAIDALSRIIASTKKLGLSLAIIFGFIATLITFNTIRLAIYVSRDEIAVMRLVGASRAFIRGPFIIAGLMYGIVATVSTMLIYWPIAKWMGPITVDIGTGINLYDYYTSHVFYLFGVIILISLVLGAVSSFLAIKRYLKV